MLGFQESRAEWFISILACYDGAALVLYISVYVVPATVAETICTPSTLPMYILILRIYTVYVFVNC